MSHTQECVVEVADRLQLPQLDLQTPIEPRPQGCAVPLTAEQSFMIKGRIRVDPKQRPLSDRMFASATRITGPLNQDLLERSIAGLVQRHESLRTTFKTLEGVTAQHIDPPGGKEHRSRGYSSSTPRHHLEAVATAPRVDDRFLADLHGGIPRQFGTTKSAQLLRSNAIPRQKAVEPA